MFTDGKFKKLYLDWNTYAMSLVRIFRSTFSKYIEDPWLSQFVEELKSQSIEFEKMWSLNDISVSIEVNKQLNHPTVGTLSFEVCNLEVSNNSVLRIIIHTPLLGTDTSDKMKQLIDNYFCI